MCTQIVLSAVVSIKRADVHVSFSTERPSNHVSCIDKSIQQLTQIFVAAMARLPEQLEPVKSLTRCGDGAPNPIGACVQALDLDFLNKTKIVTTNSVKQRRFVHRKQNQATVGVLRC